MNSGIEIGDEILASYKNLAMKRNTRYLILKPNDDCTVVEIEKEGARDETFDQFKASIEPTSSRWAVFELEWIAADGRKMSKVCLIAFAPDNAAI